MLQGGVFAQATQQSSTATGSAKPGGPVVLHWRVAPHAACTWRTNFKSSPRHAAVSIGGYEVALPVFIARFTSTRVLLG